MSIGSNIDKSARLRRYNTEEGEWVLKLEGEGMASEFHCGGLGKDGQLWWVPKHAADDRYNKIKKHARNIANKCFHGWNYERAL